MSFSTLVSKAKAYLGLAEAASSALDSASGGSATGLVDLVKDLVGIPVAEINTFATSLGAVPAALAEIKTGQKVQIAQGVFALAISAENVVVLLDPGIGVPLEAATKMAEPLIELLVADGTPADANSTIMLDRAGPANASV